MIVAVFGVLKPNEFLSSFDIKTIFINAAVVLMLSVGMTYVIITAGIDLSVGSVLVFSGVLAGKAMIAVGGGAARGQRRLGGDPRRSRGRAAASGLAWGVINGVADRAARDPAADRHARHASAWRSGSPT